MSKPQKYGRVALNPSSSSSDEDMGYDAKPPPLTTSSNNNNNISPPQQPLIAHFKNFQRNTATSAAAAGESANGIDWGDEDADSDELTNAVATPSGRGGGPTTSTPKPTSSSKRNTNSKGGISGKFPATPPSSRQSEHSDRLAGGRTITTTGSARGGGRSMVTRRPSQRNLGNHRKSVIGDDVIVLGDSSSIGVQGMPGGGGSTNDLVSTRGGSRRSNSGGSGSKRNHQHNDDADDPNSPLSGVNTFLWSRGKLVHKDALGCSYVGVDRLSKSVMMGKEIPCEVIPNLPMRYTLLKDEIARMTKLDHDNIVRYHGVDRIGDLLVIISDLVPGGRLQDLIKEHGRFDEKTASLYVYHILRGLDYLHTCGFSHCNMKSANVLVSASGVVKLSDYGSTLFLNGTGPALHEGHEAARWSAPEVVRGEGTTSSIDIWSVGCVTMELVFGEMPFEHLGSLFTVLMAVGNPELEMTLPPDSDLSPECTDFITKCLRKHPASRPKTSELLQHPFLADAAARVNTSSNSNRGFSNRSMSVTGRQSSNASSSANCDLALEQSSSPPRAGVGTPGGVGDRHSGSFGSPAVSGSGGTTPQVVGPPTTPSITPTNISPHQQQHLSVEDQEIAQLQKLGPLGSPGGGPVCAHDSSIFCRLDDTLLARSHQVCMLRRAAFFVACSTAHAQRCATRILHKCQKNRITYLKRRRLNNKTYGSSTTAGGNSGHSWPTRSDGITSENDNAAVAAANTSHIMGGSASPTPNLPNHSDHLRGGGGSSTASPNVNITSGMGGGSGSGSYSKSASSFLPMLLGNSQRQLRQDEEAAAALSARTPQQERIKKRLRASLRSPRLPPDVREQENELEAASCVEITILDLISQVELRRVSLFNRDGRPGFALSTHVRPPQWWPNEMSSSFRHKQSGSSSDKNHHHRPSSARQVATAGDRNSGGRPSHNTQSNRASQHHIGGDPQLSSPHTTAVSIPQPQQGPGGVKGARILEGVTNNTFHPNQHDNEDDDGSVSNGTADGSIADLVDIRTDDGSTDDAPLWRRLDTPVLEGAVGGELAHVASAGSIGSGAAVAPAKDTSGVRSPFSPSLRQRGVAGSGSYDATAAGGSPFTPSSPLQQDIRKSYGSHTATTAARYYFLNPRIPLEVYEPCELILKLGDESSLHHFLPPVDEGGLSVRAGMVLVGVMTTMFLVWTVITLVIVLIRKKSD